MTTKALNAIQPVTIQPCAASDASSASTGYARNTSQIAAMIQPKRSHGDWTPLPRRPVILVTSSVMLSTLSAGVRTLDAHRDEQSEQYAPDGDVRRDHPQRVGLPGGEDPFGERPTAQRHEAVHRREPRDVQHDAVERNEHVS